jgi:hypothetical protein
MRHIIVQPAAIVIALLSISACESKQDTPTLLWQQDAYVWQRLWTPAVQTAVADAPAGLQGLRVLVADLEPQAPRMVVARLDPAALAKARKPITLVARINGAQLSPALTLGPLIDEAQQLRAAGVMVAGVEIDFDCATAKLADYASWLQAQRPATATALRFSITALPTWAGAAALRQVVAAVDELVVQVHTIRAPVLFDPVAAWRDIVRVSDAVPGARLLVALPTYRAQVAGVEVAADRRQVMEFVNRLRARPVASVAGVLWFRLPIAGDQSTWTQGEFAQAVAGSGHDGARQPPAVQIVLQPQPDGPSDIVIKNPTSTAIDFPALRIIGGVTGTDLVDGYIDNGNNRWRAPHRRLAPGQSQIVGWVTGKDLYVSAQQ